MQQLLGWDVNLLGLAVHHGLLPALVPRDLLAVRPGLGGAVGGGENLAGEGVRHLRPGLGLRLVVPQLLLGAAGHLGVSQSVSDYKQLSLSIRYTDCPNLLRYDHSM